MNLAAQLLRQIDDPALSRAERARLRCQLAKELEEAGNYEAARGALGDLWQQVGERPKIADLDLRTSAEVLLRAGTLSGWIGSSKQIEGAQEIAKNLISESITIFESLDETAKAVEGQSELAYCYWREGAFDEARVMLSAALLRIADGDSDIKSVALLRSAIVELSATRYHDALSILTEAAPLFEASNSHGIKGRFHVNLAIVLKNLSTSEQRNDYADRALIEFAAASYHFEQAGHIRYQARTENNLGFLLFMTSRFTEAYEHLDRARRLFVSLKDSGSVAQVDETRARALLAEGRNADAERIVRSAVRTLEKGDEQALLAEALTTHGKALARLGHYNQSRLTLRRAIEVANHVGNIEGAGLAALTIIEELSGRLTHDEIRTIYRQADHLLANSQHPETLVRLRLCARRMVEAEDALFKEFSTPNFIYAAEQTAALLRDAHRIASVQGAVLITGETGTGKEVLACLIHQWSGRLGEMVAINCAAIPEQLIESELFGHRKGSFTDAVADYPGAVRHAAGGTLFLDEIGELSLGHQAKLLRLIENGEVHAIGAPTPEHVDVRIIAATNHNLKEEVRRGRFRDDLFYRLNTFHLEIPPLRERPEDIPVIAEYFIKEMLGRHRKRVTFTSEAIDAMRRLPLRGNVRELRSLIERTVLTATDDMTITVEAVETVALRQTQQAGFADPWANFSLREEVRLLEERFIELALKHTKGMVSRAAKLLGFKHHETLTYRLEYKNKNLLPARTPAKPRKRSIIRR
jgi:transcriptional regulator with GAF, ATPase, and Fis domain